MPGVTAVRSASGLRYKVLLEARSSELASPVLLAATGTKYRRSGVVVGPNRAIVLCRQPLLALAGWA